MAIQGHLATISIPELFSSLSQLRKSGRLCILTDVEERTFVFRRGDLVSASAGDPSRRLGNYLVRLGLVAPEDLDEITLEATAATSYFGEALIETGQVTEQELKRAVREQVVDLICESMQWEQGVFYFDDDGSTPASLPSDCDDSLLQTHSILLEVTSKADERQRIRELFPDRNVILKREEHVPLPEDLSEEQEEILSLLQNEATIGKILFSSEANIVEAATAVKELLAGGVIANAGVQVVASDANAAPELLCSLSTPEVLGRLLAALNKESSDPQEFAGILAIDPLLCAKLLKCLTLGNVEIPRTLLSVDQIVEILGIGRLRSIVVPEAVRGIFLPTSVSFWKDCCDHAVATAQLSREIAREISYRFPEEAYLGGLLHNLGMFVLSHREPCRYPEMLMESVESGCANVETLEEAHFGISHTKLGSIYAEKWRFPRPLTNTIRYHHRAERQTDNELLQIVAAASCIAHGFGFGVENLLSDGRLLESSLEHLGLTDSSVRALSARVPILSRRTYATSQPTVSDVETGERQFAWQ